jgi:hypothetical protein
MKLTEGPAVDRLEREKARCSEKSKKITLSLWTSFPLKNAIFAEIVVKLAVLYGIQVRYRKTPIS